MTSGVKHEEAAGPGKHRSPSTSNELKGSGVRVCVYTSLNFLLVPKLNCYNQKKPKPGNTTRND